MRTLLAECPGLTYRVDNTTTVVGGHASSVLPIDDRHVANVLAAWRPDVVVAMGRQARKAVLSSASAAKAAVLLVPHPASRVLTNELLRAAGCLLRDGFNGVVELRQEKGWVATVRPERCLAKANNEPDAAKTRATKAGRRRLRPAGLHAL